MLHVTTADADVISVMLTLLAGRGRPISDICIAKTIMYIRS